MNVFDSFLLHAFAAGAIVSLAAAPLGCFIVWRRMAYIGDTMSHSALLGVALGLALGINITLGIAIITVTIALLLGLSARQRAISSDTVLGILAHSSLAFGLIAIGAMPWVRVDLMGYLFGDILAVGNADLLAIGIVTALSLAVLAAIWRALVASTVSEELARAEGVKTGLIRIVFMLLIAVVVSVAMKLVGVLLITSLMIIPAATARHFARSPEAMAVIASLAGIASVALGLIASYGFDSPSGPSVVAASSVLFVLASIFSRLIPSLATAR